jgi:hypothetical protein
VSPDQIYQRAENGSTQIGIVQGDVSIGSSHTYYAPFQAPPLPEYFVDRPEVTDALKLRMLNQEAAAPGVLVVSAIHGLGGIGKSTLATDLVYDLDVQERFPDGILWATLGQIPDIFSLLSGWIQAMGDFDFRPTTQETASAHLRSILQRKAVLLVVDDAWELSHVRQFLVGGPQCRILITTRDALIAKAINAALYDLDVMTKSQALVLLSRRLKRVFIDAELEEATALAELVGYLPLALELAAAQIDDGLHWRELLKELRAEIGRLGALDLPGAEEITDDAIRKNLSLLASFNLSLKRLPPDRRRAFAWLGVLPEDVTLTPAMTATLWNVELRVARDSLRYLRDKALLLPGFRQTDNFLTYRQHDLLHDLARHLLTAPPDPPIAGEMPGLGLSLHEAHAALLNRYRMRAHNNLWHTLPDDGYIHLNLTWHMEQANWLDELHSLVREETTMGQNGWYQARDRLGQTAGYLGDVVRAWRIAQETFYSDQSPIVIGLQCRYALITASFNSMAQNIPAALLTSLMEKKIWPIAQGTAYARQMPDLNTRAEALSRLIPYLPEGEQLTLLREALTAAQTIRDLTRRTEVLGRLAPYLPEPLLREVLSAVRAIRNSAVQAGALAVLIPRLAELGSAEEALSAAQAIKSKPHKAEALCRIVAYLPEHMQLTLLRETLTAAHTIPDSAKRIEVLSKLALFLSGPPLHAALTVAQTIPDIARRAEALAVLIPRLAELGSAEEALSAAQGIQLEPYRAEALCRIAPYLPEDLLQQALTAARAVRWELHRVEALSQLVAYLPETEQVALLREILSAAEAIRDIATRAEMLSQLARYLPEPLLREAVGAAQAIQDLTRRTEVLGRLAAYLPEAEQLTLFRELVTAAQAIQDLTRRTEVLGRLAPYLPEPLLREVLTTAQPIQDLTRRAEALSQLVPYLPEDEGLKISREVIEAIRVIPNPGRRSETLFRLAPYLPKALLQQALSAARAIQGSTKQVEVLARLAQRLAELGFAEEALSAARAIQGSTKQVEVLVDLAQRLAELGFAEEALGAARAIQDATKQVEVLARLAHWLAELGFANEALSAARAIENATKQVEVLARLAQRLAKLGSVEEALSAAQAIQDLTRRAEALSRLVLYLPEAERRKISQEVLTAVRAIVWEPLRAEVLGRLAPYLPEPLLREALSAAQAIQDLTRRAEALGWIVPYLPEAERRKISQEVVTAIRSIRALVKRAEALCRLAPCLPEALLQEALLAVRAIGSSAKRVEVLAELAQRLAALPVQSLYPLWHNVLSILASYSREELLENLLAFEPIIAALGGKVALVETSCAIQNVGRWWP